MVQVAIVVKETVGIESVRVGPEIRIPVDRPHVHEYHRVFGDVEAGWKRSNFGKSKYNYCNDQVANVMFV